MSEHRAATATVLVTVRPRKIGTTPKLGAKLQEHRRRRQPFKLHAVLSIATVRAKHRLIRERRIGKIPHVRVLLIQITNTRAETATLQTDALTKAERLEPGLLNFSHVIQHRNDRLTTPVGINVGGKHQLCVIHRETPLVDTLDRAVAMIMPTGRHEAADATFGHILHIFVLALQNQ